MCRREYFEVLLVFRSMEHDSLDLRLTRTAPPPPRISTSLDRTSCSFFMFIITSTGISFMRVRQLLRQVILSLSPALQAVVVNYLNT